MDSIKHLKDGIGAGVIRSPRTNADLDPEIKAEDWCRRIGHSWRRIGGGDVCITCWEDREKLERSV